MNKDVLRSRDDRHFCVEGDMLCIAEVADVAPTAVGCYVGQPVNVGGRWFKYLGMHFSPSATPAFAATHTRAGMFLAMRQACKRAREYGVLQDPYTLCHLIRAFVLPLGLYGSQALQPRANTHALLSQLPLQLYWLRAACKFLNLGPADESDQGRCGVRQELSGQL
ncbi:hypothetical protein HaLaN_00032 [Haematococcus lacustris]|uniref:Uncharacterized protein n=1 Tax=Haematococcus lacustris TaxID=44745 RepID=A0A699YQZ2_HAELA|nr:hypothetical protein HaLaN_00032 [Haematococcus lacustris]